MSLIEKNFLKWFGGIASLLIVASVASIIGMYKSQAVSENSIINNTNNINKIQVYHDRDVKLIREELKDFKTIQLITQEDVKEILKNQNKSK